MAQSFKIAKVPSFREKVSIPVIGGEAVAVPFTFHNLDRREQAALWDRHSEKVRELEKATGQAGVSLEEITTRQVAIQAEMLMQIVEGWDFEDPFNEASVERLLMEVPGSDEAILRTYTEAYARARLGN